MWIGCHPTAAEWDGILPLGVGEFGIHFTVPNSILWGSIYSMRYSKAKISSIRLIVHDPNVKAVVYQERIGVGEI